MTVAESDRRIDFIWLMFFIVSGGALSAVLATTVFELSVFLSGILCVGLLAIGRREGYLIGLYSSLSYSLLALSNGLYGEVYLNLFFFVPTGIIGYLMWQRHTLQDNTVAMRHMNWSQRLIIVVICVVGTVGVGVLLSLNPNQNSPFVDATTNVLSIAATFLTMWRYKEQWLLYILVNLVSIALWMLRVVAGGEAGDLMVMMWLMFLLNSVFGYWRWHMGAEQTAVVNADLATKSAPCDVA